MALLAGVGVGGAVGSIVGALIGMGMPEYEAKRYEGRTKEGGTRDQRPREAYQIAKNNVGLLSKQNEDE
jgi:hypothetical protein